MKIIYIDDKHITFTGSPADHTPGSTLIENPEPGEITATKLLEKLRKTKSLTILSPDHDKIFERLRNETGFVAAGGGVVRGGSGRILLIYRNGRWDLPKGHLEAGEAIGECAMREVAEECGVGELTLGRFLTETFHVYTFEGRTVFKATSWFAMDSTGCGDTCPQREEGIERAEWLTTEQIRGILPTTYQTIRDVFAAYYKTEPKNQSI